MIIPEELDLVCEISTSGGDNWWIDEAAYESIKTTMHTRNGSNRDFVTEVVTFRSVKHATAYTYKLSWQKAIDFISLIEPYLVIKKPQAQLVIVYAAHKPGKGNGKYNPELKKFILSSIKTLNGRGISE